MKTANPAPIQGPIIVGQISFKAANQFSGRSPKANFINRLQVLLTSFSALGCLSLVVGALLHHQLNALSWTFLAIAPVPVLTTITTIYERGEKPAERTVAIVDWLKHMPPMSLFSIPEQANLGWLTNEGLYTFTRSYYPWGKLKIRSFEPDIHTASSEGSHLLILQAFEENAIKYWFLLAFLISLSVIIVAALNSLYFFCKHYGLRDDVLSLTFATVFDMLAWKMFGEALFKINRDGKHGWEMPFFINARHVQLDDLTKFVDLHR